MTNNEQASSNALSTNFLIRKLQLRRLQKLITPDSPPTGWYQQRKRAEREIQDISKGQLLLAPYQLYYHGDDSQHSVHHKKCGNTFELALTTLRLEGAEICPFCHGGLISRIGSVDRIFEFIYEISGGQVLFVKNQQLACSDNTYLFYHLGCKKNFVASFDHVVKQNREGTGSGCLRCDNQDSPNLVDHFYR